MKGESKGRELAFVRFMECVPPLDEMDGALRCLSQLWASTGSAEKGHDVEKKEKIKILWRLLSGLKLFFSRLL